MHRVRLYHWNEERLEYTDKLFADFESAKAYADRSFRHSAKIFSEIGELVYHIVHSLEQRIESYA